MPRKKPVWKAPERALEPMPEISGNKVNGLGETEFRRPSPFFWHEPQYHEFGDMQRYTIGIMYGLEDGDAIRQAFCVNEDFRPDSPSGHSSSKQFIHRGPDPIDVASERVSRSPGEWSKLVKEFALAHHADVVGISMKRQEWIFKGFQISDFEKYVIVLGVAHDYEEIAQAPPLPGNNRAIVEVGKQYTRAARAAAELNNYIRSNGYETTCYPGPTAQALAMIPAAIEAGLGELGKHGSLINRKLGSSFRLSAIGTNMPLSTDQRDVFGADDFCIRCQVCSEACPPDAIFSEKQWVRGEQKWYFTHSMGCCRHGSLG